MSPPQQERDLLRHWNHLRSFSRTLKKKNRVQEAKGKKVTKKNRTKTRKKRKAR
ncbi:hypothetical protein TWF281_009739 [Arthrobotrys megalospora]